ncbi:unnamed protein product [Mycena citricolor]|uniref:DUF6535 domain-containing protein n=1 Tax=Mycena citricolor TaxID=2018698 RepID=A0AAD2GT57_9AGAR|nr:unnamed protein product [Mycena citricolor]
MEKCYLSKGGTPVCRLPLTMSQADEQQTDKRNEDEERLERERASGNKLWGVYISEAEKYDQGLIDGWRSDMDGLLIFAGLFSGVVTTFIIDSYKTLNPDSGSQTVALLNQISLQLAHMNNGTAMADALPPTAPFSPPISALVCNAFWFTSLALSLSSALVATLVKQWTQEYQHRTSMFSSPSIRARVYMYLYYGLRRFNMHAVVGVPPLLLHASLVLFLVGLVAFLVPINIIIMGMTSAMLCLFVAVYGTFSALPLFFLDCPYQTPLTQILWSLNQSLGSMLRAYIWSAAAVCKAVFQKRTAVTDLEKPAGSPVANDDASAKSPAPPDSRPQLRSMVDALKSAALHPPVETETRALAWTVRSLSDDEELEKLVEGLPQTLWDFDRNRPRSVYQALFQSLLRDPHVHLGQRLADFMAGSNSNLLEHKDRLRRQLSVLRAIWAVCAFSLHTGSPLQRPIGEADVDNALLGSKFIDSDDGQSMLPDVSALIHLNIIESWSSKRALTQPSSSDVDIRAEAQKRRQQDMHRAYVDYLLALSKCAASFQRDTTNLLFHRSQMRFTDAYGYLTLQDALEQLISADLEKAVDNIEHASDKAEDNVVFAARLMIAPFAQVSEYPWGRYHSGLGLFLARHPSLAASNPEFNSTHHYTRVLCYWLCDQMTFGSNLQPCVDALQLIYRRLLQSYLPPRDLDTHLRVLRTLRTAADDIPTHRLAAIVQSVVLKSLWLHSSEWEQLPSIFGDEAWFRSVLSLDNDKRTGRRLARQVYDCAYVGVVTTFFEQCTAQNQHQTEQDLDWATLKSIPYAVEDISSVIPTALQRRFADTVSEFMRKYPENCLADDDGLCSVLLWAVHEYDSYDGWMTNVDSLRVLDVAVSEVQTDNQQQSHRDNAQGLREWIQNRLLLETIPPESVLLVSDGQWRDHHRGCHFLLI